MQILLAMIGEAGSECQQDCGPAQGIDAKCAANEKIAPAMSRRCAMHRQHQHQASVHKKEHDTREAEIAQKHVSGRVPLADMEVDALLPPVGRNNAQYRQRSNQIEIDVASLHRCEHFGWSFGIDAAPQVAATFTKICFHARRREPRRPGTAACCNTSPASATRTRACDMARPRPRENMSWFSLRKPRVNKRMVNGSKAPGLPSRMRFHNLSTIAK